jgi:hypothetical protein
VTKKWFPPEILAALAAAAIVVGVSIHPWTSYDSASLSDHRNNPTNEQGVFLAVTQSNATDDVPAGISSDVLSQLQKNEVTFSNLRTDDETGKFMARADVLATLTRGHGPPDSLTLGNVTDLEYGPYQVTEEGETVVDPILDKAPAWIAVYLHTKVPLTGPVDVDIPDGTTVDVTSVWLLDPADLHLLSGYQFN